MSTLSISTNVEKNQMDDGIMRTISNASKCEFGPGAYDTSSEYPAPLSTFSGTPDEAGSSQLDSNSTKMYFHHSKLQPSLHQEQRLLPERPGSTRRGLNASQIVDSIGAYTKISASDGLGELLSDICYYLVQQANSEGRQHNSPVKKKEIGTHHLDLKALWNEKEQTLPGIRRNLELFFKGLTELNISTSYLVLEHSNPDLLISNVCS